ncbi:MAG: DUF512 domain-containing protein [Clostridia bacterium]|nr:DUF512 domain-containing protein [Clostridia bacterium]
MPQTIIAVEPGSIAEQLELQPGDRLVSVNGKPILDWIDYQAFTSEENIDLVIERAGEEIEFSLEKDDWEPLGLTFDSRLMSGIRECVNKCIFCFVDQLPACARDSLRVKDDDWRLSLMTGSFVTLTNVSDSELQRIIDRHASPLYVSVHTTDMKLRAHMLGTERGALLMKQLNRMKAGGIQFHAQAVLCPGINDGPQLEKTIADLAALYPACQSLALVPVGLTNHREGLCGLRKYARDEARAVLDAAEKWQKRLLKKHGTNFVFPSDEFYLAAKRPIPPDEFYEDYAQIENGVGMMRQLETELEDAYGEADLESAKPGRLLAPVGVDIAPFMKSLMRRFPIPGVEIEVVPVENGFFGPNVTVTGLLTGGDLIRGLAGKSADRVLVTECMLRDQEDVFLDDLTLGEVQEKVGIPFVKVGRRGDELLDAMMNRD